MGIVNSMKRASSPWFMWDLNGTKILCTVISSTDSCSFSEFLLNCHAALRCLQEPYPEVWSATKSWEHSRICFSPRIQGEDDIMYFDQRRQLVGKALSLSSAKIYQVHKNWRTSRYGFIWCMISLVYPLYSMAYILPYLQNVNDFVFQPTQLNLQAGKPQASN